MSNSNAGTPGGQKSRSNRPRRRSRGRRPGGGGGGQPREQQEQQQQAQPAEKQQQGRQRDDGGRGGRRRSPRRHAAEPATGEVLRQNAQPEVPVQPMRKRPIADPSETSEPVFGCPMLTRTRLGMPFLGGRNMPRCSMGWAVHDEDEVLLCMNTPARDQCWKENPEFLQELIVKLRPQIEAELNDDESAAD